VKTNKIKVDDFLIK